PARAPAPPTPPRPGALLRGIAASTGIALGPVRRLKPELEPSTEPVAQAPEVEWQRLEAARGTAREAIEHDRAEMARRGAGGEAAIFSAHLALLDDEALLTRARTEIDAGAAAETAWRQASEKTAEQWRALDDELLRERAVDVEDTGRRVLAALAGRQPRAGLERKGVLVVSELTPGDAVALDPELVQGIATAHGTATAHAAILARALGLPAVVGLGLPVLAVEDGTPVLLDGSDGTVLVAPNEDAERQARGKIERTVLRRRSELERAGEPALTRDGTPVEVSANLGGAGDASAAVALGADGVGLLRTEFLFLDRPEIPTEQEQAQTLAEIARALGGRPLIVRTLDVGADKPLPALPMAPERNPFLGLRGVRLSLRQPELLAVQLRAILRVAAEHPVKVMFPMVASVAELEAVLAAVSEARSATGVSAPMEVGIMVEVPSAAVLAEQLARHVDFFSIGTNDLTQYAMAAERGNELVADLLTGPQPAVLRLVRATTDGALAHHRWVGVCGELAGDPAAALLLVGLGARELSMAPPLVPAVKEALRSVTLAEVTAAAEQALDARDAVQARAFAADLL
ncbi:MAG: phosphoenolpyruvate--protein phosphotransferase, partial [Solirubrobacteraceae bacterium]